MRITELQFDASIVRGPAESLPARSPGLHLSDIYSDIERTIGARANHLTEQELSVYRSMGFQWEWVIAEAFARSLAFNNFIRPGEISEDGIICSPDLIDITVSPPIVMDTKATWRSSRKLDALEKYFWTWLVQLKGYCYVCRTTRAQLLVMCVNGDWAPPVPCIRYIDIIFTERELLDNWAMCVGHARSRGWLPRVPQGEK